MKRNEKEKEKVESARDIFTEGEEMDQVIWSIMSVMWSGYAGTLVGAERWENQPTADNPAFARDSLLLTPQPLFHRSGIYLSGVLAPIPQELVHRGADLLNLLHSDPDILSRGDTTPLVHLIF